MYWIVMLSLLAMGSTVIKVDSKNTHAAISHPEKKPWQAGDILVITRQEKKIAWGIVKKAAAKGAVIKLTKVLGRVRVGDLVQARPPSDDPEVKPQKAKPKDKGPHQGVILAKPHFRAIFDLMLSYQPNRTPTLTFLNNHSLLLFSITPDRETEFVFEVSANPRFFELNYDWAPWLELRVGRIWIPFDDSEVHKFYGGRPQISRFLQPGATAFLPEIWADLGVGARASLLVIGGTEVAVDAYAVNGFGERSSGDPNPSLTERGESYPEFSSTQLQDNNDNKAVGGRLSMSVSDFLDVGTSVYQGVYSNRGKTPSALRLFGVDGRIRMGSYELKGGSIYGVVDLVGAKDADGLPVSFTKRGGYYAEIAYWTGDTRWALRGGQAQNDSRFLFAPSDQSIFGAIITSHLGPLLCSIEYSKDFEVREGKFYEFAALRLASHF